MNQPIHSVPPHETQKPDEQDSIKSSLKDIVQDFQQIIRSEIHLVKAEASDTFRKTSRNVVLSAVFGVFALLGLLPLLAFIVIGLGRLMNHNYWLSSFIVSILMIGGGAFFAYRAAKKLGQHDFSMPHTRDSIQKEKEILTRKVQEISDVTKRRAL